MSAGSRGAAFERRIRGYLEAEGWLVVRAAGSRGPFDLIALRSGGHGHCEARLVQCKVRRRDLTPASLKAMRQAARDTGASPWLAHRGDVTSGYAVTFELVSR